MSTAAELRWAYLQNWAGWWLVREQDTTAELVYGPFYTRFELECAALVHGAPAPPEGAFRS